jgi:TIR domain/Interferon-induced transmembrane protein
MLSYSRRDEDAVKALVTGLQAARCDVWFDHNLAGGDAWWDAILQRIRDASVFLFALSDASLHSTPCRLELDYALALGRSILPVQVGPVSSLRANPLAELQIIEYDPGSAQSGFAILAAVGSAAGRVRPLPDPLPPPPPIPFAYLLALGRQIDSAEFGVAEQAAAVDQLRRALGEETDETVRRDVLAMLRNLADKPWTTRRTERDVAALLFAYGESGAEPAAPVRPAPAPPPQPAMEADPREWFARRLDQILSQRVDEDRTAEADPPYWRPVPGSGDRWRTTFPTPAARPDPPGARDPAPTAAPPPSTPWPPRPPSQTGPSQTGPNQTGPIHAGPSHASPSQTGPNQTGPIHAGPSHASPSQTGPIHAGPSHASPSQTGPNQTGPIHAGPSHASPSQTGPSHAGPGQTESSQADPGSTARLDAPAPPVPDRGVPDRGLLGVLAVLAFFPCGIVALAFVALARKRDRAGDPAGARAAARLARAWAVAGLVIGALVWLTVVLG